MVFAYVCCIDTGTIYPTSPDYFPRPLYRPHDIYKSTPMQAEKDMFSGILPIALLCFVYRVRCMKSRIAKRAVFSGIQSVILLYATACVLESITVSAKSRRKMAVFLDTLYCFKEHAFFIQLEYPYRTSKLCVPYLLDYYYYHSFINPINILHKIAIR